MQPATDLFEAYNRAERLIASGDLRQAADMCKEILDTNPDFAYGYHLMASLFRATGTYDRALTFAEMATRMAPDITAFHIQQGQVLCSLQEWEKAAETFTTAHNIDPANAVILLLLASTFTQRGQYDVALGLLERARGINDLPEIDEHEGLCHVIRGKPEQAEKCFDRLIERKPGYFMGYIHKGRLLMDGKHNPQAEALMARALKLNPRSYDALYALAVLNDWQGHPEIAIRYAMEATKAKPLGCENHLFLGTVLMNQKHYKEAEQVLRHVLTLRPNQAFAMQLLFNSLYLQRRMDEALEYVKAFLAIEPDNAMMRHFLAMLSGTAAEKPPAIYVSNLFDGYADQFDHHLQQVLGYTIPTLIADTLRGLPAFAPMKEASLLDLGCGTGLVAAALKDCTNERIGIDLSSKMLDKARSKQLYSELYELDVVSFMLTSPRKFDLVVAADVLVYIGNLSPFMNAARNVLPANGLLAFTVEKDVIADEFRLHASGRYTHASPYVERLAATEGYDLLVREDCTIRMENYNPVPGLLFILRKMQSH
jgi:predicted TPR repeat methyltransferase